MDSTNDDVGFFSKSEDEMPRDGRSGRKRQSLLQTADLSLHHFADSPNKPQQCSRVRKSVVNTAAPLVVPKSGSGKEVVDKKEAELDWYEKDLDDFVIEDPSLGDEEEEDLNSIKDKNDKKKKKVKPAEEDKSGLSWPVDLWYMLSSYIHPEDIGRFARLCKSACSVIQLAGFWRNLYYRYYQKETHYMPKHLRPDSIERLHGLRARVIRSLFYTYSPLVERVKSKGPMEDEPHELKGYRCLLAWHQPAKPSSKGWQFCFKFQKPSLQALSSRPVCKQDVYNGYNDLYYHPDEGCIVLQVTCCHFSSDNSVAALMGLLLNQVYVTLSTGLRHHRLRLHFDSRANASQNAPSDVVLVLDDVIAMKLMDWWHPQYPFTS